ncbi:MAG: hypothetical protein II956_11490 [Bacteroidales bacterium]|nr:hypothetical protein [Bacteroidales bacterium]
MDVEYLRHQEIDYDAWQDCIDNSVNACLYSRTWFLDCVSTDWRGLVLGDYEAVMPLFFSDGKLYLPDCMEWLGIYSGKLPQKEVAKKFLQFIANNFKYADIRLDKFSGFFPPKKGRKKVQYLYQFDTVKCLSDKLANMSARIKNRILKFGEQGFRFTKAGEGVFVESFMRCNTNKSFKEIETIGRIISESSKRKSCVSFFLDDINNLSCGIITVIFDGNYIFIPQLEAIGKYNTVDETILMLFHILTYFEGAPLILVVDPQKIRISESILQGMGAKKFGYLNYRKDKLSGIRDFFKLN